MACLVASFFMATDQLYADKNSNHNSADPLHVGSKPASPSTGKFFGYEQKTGKIWINDFVYIVSPDCKILGSSTKLGMISAIKYQETVAFKTASNPKHPSIPYIIEIRRK